MADYYISLGQDVNCYMLSDGGKVFLNPAASAYIDLTMASTVQQTEVLQKLAEKSLSENDTFIPFFKKDGAVVDTYAFCNPIEDIGFNVQKKANLDSITQIKDNAFRHNYTFDAVSLDKVLSIGDFSFSDCQQLKDIYIGKDIKYISQYAFQNTDPFAQQTIQSLFIDSVSSKISDYQKNYPFGLDFSTAADVVHVNEEQEEPGPQPGDGKLSVADGVEKHILADKGIAYWNESLSDVVDLTQYGNLEQNDVGQLPDKAFAAIFSKDLSVVGQDVFKDSKLSKAQILDSVLSIYNSAFQNCTLLDISLEDSNNLKHIGASAFYNVPIQHARFSQLTSIGDRAFEQSDLKTVSFGKYLNGIGEDAFSSKENDTSAYFNDMYINELKAMKNWPFGLQTQNIFALTSDQPEITGDIVLSDEIATKEYVENYILDHGLSKNDISSIQITRHCRSIAPGAFESFIGLLSVDIPKTVESIGLNTFYDCSSLTSLTFKDRTWQQVLAVPGYPFGVKADIINAVDNRPSIDTALVLSENMTLETIQNGAGRFYFDASTKSALDLTGLEDITEEVVDSQLESKHICRNTKFGIVACLTTNARKVENSAFAELSNIYDISFADGENCLTSIQADSFKNCTIHKKVCFSSWNMHDIAIADAYPFGLADDTCLTATDMADVVVIDNDVDANSDYVGLSGATFALIRKSCNVVSGFSTNNLNTHKDNYFTNNQRLSTLVCKYDCAFANYAFSGCSRLAVLDLPEVQYLAGPNSYSAYNNIVVEDEDRHELNKANSLPIYTGHHAFSFGNLTSISIPKCKVIAGQTFYQQAKLQDLDLPQTIDIGEQAFSNMQSLSSITAPKLKYLGQEAFDNSVNSISSISLSSLKHLYGLYGGQFTASFAKRQSKLLEVSLPKVTQLPVLAFAYNESLSSIDMPLLSSIGEFAFEATGFKTFDFENIKHLDYGAFMLCKNLVSAYIPNVDFHQFRYYNYSYEYCYQFEDCYNLTAVAIPAAVSLPTGIFSGCSALEAVEYDADSISCHGQMPFGGEEIYNNIKYIASPYAQSISSISFEYLLTAYDFAFTTYPNLLSIYAYQLDVIPYGAFYRLSCLSSIDIDCKEVQGIALAGTSALTAFTVQPWLTSINLHAFGNAQDFFADEYDNYNYYTIQDLSVAEYGLDKNPVFVSDVEGIHYPALFKYVDENDYSKGIKLHIGTSSLTSMPEGTVGFNSADECFDGSNFYYADALNTICYVSSLNVPSTFASGQFSSMHSYSASIRAVLPNLQYVSVASGSSAYTDMNGCNVIVDSTSALIVGSSNSYLCGEINTIKTGAFHNKLNLTEVDAVDASLSSLTSIEQYSFSYCDQLTSLTIACPTEGAAQMSVQYKAICHNPNLKYLKLANISAFETSGKAPFEGCSNIQQIEIDGLTSIPPYICNTLSNKLNAVKFSNVHSIQDAAFAGCNKLSSASFGNQLTSIGASAFYDCRQLSSIEDIDYSSIKHIGSSSFAKTKFQKAEFTQLSSVPAYAFESSEVSSIDMPSLTSIGDYAFRDCKLKSVNLPNVKQIGNYAFADNTILETVDMPNLTSIGNNAFSGCIALTSINAPLLQSISNYAFRDCKSIQSIHMPNLEHIGMYSFYGCEKLNAVAGLSNVQTVQTGAFISCESLVSAEFDKARRIDSNAFWHSGLKDMSFQSCLTALHDEAFNKQITSYVDDNITIVGYDKYCPSLSSVWFKGRTYAQISSQIDTETYYDRAKNIPYWGIQLSCIKLDNRYTSMLKLAKNVEMICLLDGGIVYSNTSAKREVKWLQSSGGSGSPYINTGILPDKTTKIEVKFDPSAINKYSHIFGVEPMTYIDIYGWKNNGKNSFFIKADSDFYIYFLFCVDETTAMQLPIDHSNECTVLLEDGKITVNGIEHSFETTEYVPLQKELPLFTAYDNVYDSYLQNAAKCRIYSFKLWKEDQLLQELVPALDWNGIPCMHDKVTNKNFYNANGSQDAQQFTYEEYD